MTGTEQARPGWRPANNGAGKRIWFLVRGLGTEADHLPVRERYHFGNNGNLIRYASHAAAQRAADKLNAQEAAETRHGQLTRYRSRMTQLDVWPAAQSPAEAAGAIRGVVDRHADVLVWDTNGRHPMDDLLAAWLVLGVITEAQAITTSKARAIETGRFLAAYRANPPQPSDEQIAEMRAAFGPGTEVVNVITGHRRRV